jgi:hypothetical protein
MLYNNLPSYIYVFKLIFLFHRQRVYLESELSELQRKKVEMLADKLLDMNVFELRYFSIAIKEKMLKTSGINPMKINLDWPSVKRDGMYFS